MKRWHVSLIVLFLFCLVAACSKQDLNELKTTSASQNGAALTPSKTKVDVPTITCGNSTQTEIEITVKAGASGAAAGFSLQWMTAAAYAANGNQWLSSDDPALCKASFSGNANLSNYSLLAGESVTVKVGDFLFDNGASTNCDGELTCGTAYVFRAFAHATTGSTSGLMRSDFTPNLTCSTLDCRTGESCTYTQGYWKNHGPDPSGMNTNMWPASVQTDGLKLGSVLYTQDQLLAILKTQPAKNGLISLAHQLIAAKLNVANGADATDVNQAIIDADLLIGGLQVPPTGTGSLLPSQTSALTDKLDSYNSGAIGPGHCK